MDRKVALATAAAVVLTVSAGTAAVAANLGLLSSTDDTVGQLQAARGGGATTRTIVIEEVVPVEGTVVVEGPLPAGLPAPDGGYEDDDEHEEEEDDDEHEEEEEEEEEDEDDEDDEGHDDDD